MLKCVKLQIGRQIFGRRVQRTQMNVTRALALPTAVGREQKVGEQEHEEF
jgi:hypothetical protein